MDGGRGVRVDFEGSEFEVVGATEETGGGCGVAEGKEDAAATEACLLFADEEDGEFAAMSKLLLLLTIPRVA